MYMVYEHGGDIYRNKVRLDFSVNTNPLGMSENVKKAIAENIEQFGIYPDAMCVNLRNAIAEKEQVGVDNVLCSNGAAEMIFAVVRAVMPKKSLLLAPTFSEYERALKSVGSQICYYYLKEENDFELQDDFIDYLEKGKQIIREEREFLMGELKNLGFKVFNSDVNFILFKGSVGLDKSLLKREILIRNCGNFNGLDEGFYRIAVKKHDENAEFIRELGDICG